MPHVVLINPFEVPEGRAQALASLPTRGSALLMWQSGPPSSTFRQLSTTPSFWSSGMRSAGTSRWDARNQLPCIRIGTLSVHCRYTTELNA